MLGASLFIYSILIQNKSVIDQQPFPKEIEIMKCVACGSTSLIDGDLVDMKGGLMRFFKLKEIPKWKSTFGKGIREVRAFGCVNCLHLQFSVDFIEEDLQRYRQFEGKQLSVLEMINAETDGLED
jgi:hypothetical protein